MSCGRQAGILQRALHRLGRADAVLGGRGDVKGIGRAAIADDLGQNLRAARLRKAPALPGSTWPRLRPSPVRRDSCRTAGRPSWDDRCCGSSRPADRRPPSAARCSGISVPPATMACASPQLDQRKASPIASAPAAHADTGAKFGPRRFQSIAIALDALSSDHHRDGRTDAGGAGPPCRRRAMSSTKLCKPPDRVPYTQPMSSALSSVIVQPGVIERLARGGHGQLAKPIAPPRFTGIHVLRRIEAPRLPADVHIQGRGIEQIEMADAALARQRHWPMILPPSSPCS